MNSGGAVRWRRRLSSSRVKGLEDLPFFCFSALFCLICSVSRTNSLRARALEPRFGLKPLPIRVGRVRVGLELASNWRAHFGR